MNGIDVDYHRAISTQTCACTFQMSRPNGGKYIFEPLRTSVRAAMDYSSSAHLCFSHLSDVLPDKRHAAPKLPARKRVASGELGQKYIGQNVLITGVVTATGVFTFGLKGMHAPLRYFQESS